MRMSEADAFGGCRRIACRSRTHQVVVENQIRLGKTFSSANGNQSRITRAGSNQIDFSKVISGYLCHVWPSLKKESPSFDKEDLIAQGWPLILPTKACRPAAHYAAIDQHPFWCPDFRVILIAAAFPSSRGQWPTSHCSFRRRSQWRGRAGFSPASQFPPVEREFSTPG